MASDESLAVFLHSSRYDRIYQAVALLAAAASMGWRCHLFLFYGALLSYIEGGWNEQDFGGGNGRHESRGGNEEPATIDRIARGFELANVAAAEELMTSARQSGNLTVYACSASIKIIGLDTARVRERVDEIVGIPTMLRIVAGTRHVLYI